MTLIFFFSGCTKDVENHPLILSIKRPTPGTAAPAKPDPPPEEETPEDPDESELISGYPMTVVNREDAEKVKTRIQNGIEPQASAFKVLLTDADEALNFRPDPPLNITVVIENLWPQYEYLQSNSMPAYSSALAWFYTGNIVYAEKAAEICRVWAEKSTSFDGFNSTMATTHRFIYMLYAADILKGYPGWKQADQDNFEKWWRQEVLKLHQNTLNRWNVGNEMSASVLGVIAAGAVFEDMDLVSAGLHVFNTYFEEGYLHNDYQLDPDWRFTVDQNGVWLTADADRGHQGFGYSAIDLALIGQILEIARYHGTDWWHREAVKGATMKGAIETYFGWVMNPLTFPFTKPGETPPGPPNFGESILELANYHYPGEIPGLQEWLNNQRPVRELFGDKYITLNRGGLLP